MTEKEERKNTKKIFSDLSNVNELLLKWVGIKLLMVCWRTFYAFLDGFSLLCHWNVMHFFFPWGCLYQALHLQDKGGPGGHDPHLFRNCTLLGMLFLEIFFFCHSPWHLKVCWPRHSQNLFRALVYESPDQIASKTG